MNWTAISGFRPRSVGCGGGGTLPGATASEAPGPGEAPAGEASGARAGPGASRGQASGARAGPGASRGQARSYAGIPLVPAARGDEHAHDSRRDQRCPDPAGQGQRREHLGLTLVVGRPGGPDVGLQLAEPAARQGRCDGEILVAEQVVDREQGGLTRLGMVTRLPRIGAADAVHRGHATRPGDGDLDPVLRDRVVEEDVVVELRVVRERVHDVGEVVLHDVGLGPAHRDVGVADPDLRRPVGLVGHLGLGRRPGRAGHTVEVERVVPVGVLGGAPVRVGDLLARHDIAEDAVLDPAARPEHVVDGLGDRRAPVRVQDVVGGERGHPVERAARRGHRGAGGRIRRGGQPDEDGGGEEQGENGRYASPHRFSRCPIARSASRRSWRSRRDCRLSYSRLPVARAISTFARPSLK